MLQGEREITLRFLAEPTDINFEGKVRGGAVMKWIDQAGYPLEQYAKRLMELRKGIEEGARIHAGLRAERDRGVPVMAVKSVDGRRVGRCP